MMQVQWNGALRPHEIAYDQLDRIAWRHLPEQGRFKEHYLQIIDCLRTYLADRYGIELEGRSVAELKRALRSHPLPPEVQQTLIELFTENERVQSSQWLPGFAGARQALERARNLIAMTAPGARPPAQAPVAAAA